MANLITAGFHSEPVGIRNRKYMCTYICRYINEKDPAEQMGSIYEWSIPTVDEPIVDDVLDDGA